MFLAAAVQMTSTSDAEANWCQARDLISRAASYGASLVATPENSNYLGPAEEKVRLAEPIGGPTCGRFAGLARELGIHLLLGSFNERRDDDPARCHNTSVLFGPDGQVIASYRKIHLFDVDVSETVRYRESDRIAAGSVPVVADSPVGRLGLSICYDLRFGNLYRRLVRDGAEILCVPAAFTLTTGRAHWEVLVRARAIECQAFVIAPAQCGRHDDEGLRETFGHAMIVDPWGQVLATAAEGPGLALAEIDLDRVAQIRRAIPVAEHFRPGL
ncbi:carbon-nitrogen hydrolase family protein [Tautonia sociabilis]|uniref:Carbon-nitrogen hydrolase family protein n=1 Tax=Tautonia sociabilis TaxID=2080755 RepID=A0A432MIT8_9BACT|nr:carbon-nitrogen hydrolase family protein [Tautonia sociabilis]RUL87273.1 carbon-nitrogen hydrolase family protein [Tautonia sociabilis]